MNKHKEGTPMSKPVIYRKQKKKLTAFAICERSSLYK